MGSGIVAAIVAFLSPFDDPTPKTLAIGVTALLIVVALGAGAFAVDVGTAAPEPVAYADTVTLGLSTETDESMAGDVHIPRSQVFFSQFQYVVGYAGIDPMRADLESERRAEQLGYPIAVYVEPLDDADPDVREDGLLTATGSAHWVPATEVWYVVESDARTPGGPAIVPFESRSAASSFASAHGGTVVDWATLRERDVSVDTAANIRATAPDRWDRADGTVAETAWKLDRPVSAVVGTDAETIQDAIEMAPANTTVLVPPGTYEETVTVSKPITIAGQPSNATVDGGFDAAEDGSAAADAGSGTAADDHAVPTIDGGGNGSVITARAADVAVTDLRLVNTGSRTRDSEAVSEQPEDDEAWDTNVQLGYGHGDAGIRGISAPGLLVETVAIDTNASGVLLREGSNAVIRDVRVDGTGTWQDGFMGVVAMESHIVIENATFTGGRDGVYLHRSDGSVIRDSTFSGGRYGIHLMYTSDALIADNVIRDTEIGGITVMTRPSGNAIVGNDVRDTPTAIQASGLRTYVGYNTLANNDLGVSMSSRSSLYEHNVIVGNELGARATTVIPSTTLARNDFVDNDRHATAGAGPLRVWTDGETGNHWEGAYGPTTNGVYDRPYLTSSPVDGALHREPAVTTLAEAPARKGLSALRGSVPGMRSGSVMDAAPARDPFAPDRVDAVRHDPDGVTIASWRSATTSPDTDIYD